MGRRELGKVLVNRDEGRHVPPAAMLSAGCTAACLMP
jgi:hypothetical protein